MSAQRENLSGWAPSESARFVLEVSRQNEAMGFRILAGHVDGVWAEYLDDGWPFVSLRALVAKDASHLMGHWIWGGNGHSIGNGVIAIPANSEYTGQFSHLSMFNVDRDKVIVTVQPNLMTLDRFFKCTLGSRMRAMIEADGVWIQIYNFETKGSVHVSNLFTEDFGISESTLQTNALAWRDVVVPEDQSIFDEMIMGLRDNGLWAGEIGLRENSGGIRYFQYFCGKFIDSGVNTAIGKFTETTARKSMMTRHQSEVTLHAKLLQSVEQSKEGFALTDAAGNFLYMNDEHLRIFGFDHQSQVIGKSWTILYDGDEQKRLLDEVFPAIEAKGLWKGRARARRSDNSTFPEELTLSLLPDGGIACNCRDVSAEVQMAKKIAQSEQLFRGFAENMPAAVVMRDLKGHYQYINRFALLAYPEILADAIGRHASDVLGEENWTQLAAIEQSAIQCGGVMDYNREVILRGETHHLEGVIFPQSDAAGEVTQIWVVWNDVTIKRRQQLETEKAIALQLQLISMQRDFVSMVSHEFRTPLTALQGSHYLINKIVGDQDNSKMRRYMDLQNDAITNLCELTGQVRSFNSLEFQTHQLELQERAPVPILMELVRRSNEMAEQIQVTFSSPLSSDFKLQINPNNFEHAVTNLISNAKKYSKRNDIVIVKAGIEKSRFCVTVTDTGIGIPANEQTRLFETFFRASNVGNIPGAGLGLATVKRIMILHGGTVNFVSQEGLGTTFELFFPVSRDTTHSFLECGKNGEETKKYDNA